MEQDDFERLACNKYNIFVVNFLIDKSLDITNIYYAIVNKIGAYAHRMEIR